MAFSASYEGPTEVYTMPIEGGLPTRRTYDGGSARVVAWTPRNTILYATTKFSTLPNVQMAEVDLATNRRTIVPLAQASDGAMTSDGTLYFTRFDWQGSNTKRYRGGTAQSLWKDGRTRRSRAAHDRVHRHEQDADVVPQSSLLRVRSNERLGEGSEAGRDEYLEQRHERRRDLRQETHHTDYDVQTPSISPDGKVVYQQGADIWLVDVATRELGATQD